MSKMIEELQEGISRLSVENARLKELNRELYEVVSELSCYKDSPVPHTLIDFAEKVLIKVKGEEK